MNKIEVIVEQERPSEDYINKRIKTILSAKTEGKLSYWECHLNKGLMNDLKKRLEKLVSARKKWAHVMYKELFRKMNVHFPHGEEFMPDHLKNTDEVLIAFCNEFKKIVELNETPSQKTIKEST